MKTNKLQKHSYTFMLLGLMAVVLLFFTILKGSMLWKGDVWLGIAMQFPEYGVITLGLMFCFICGKMDMSFVALGDFATIMAVQYMGAHADSPAGATILVGILIALGIAAAIGLPLTEWLYKKLSKNHPQKGIRKMKDAADIVVEKEDI